ncbi:MAG: hypothetical protein ACK4UN_15680, partial [Limisphaerales bacterium]
MKSKNFDRLAKASLASALALAAAQTVSAQTQSTTQLPDVVIQAEAEYDEHVQPTFLPAVRETEIFSGKK